MRIVIATGIYPPEVGGPAPYAEGVKKELEISGHTAPVVLFSSFKKYPSGIRHFLYTLKLLRVARKADAIFAFDTYSVGVPAAFVGLLLHKPVIIRIGGDFVWERYVERTRELVPLLDFYAHPRALILKERLARFFVRWMLKHAELAFNTRWLLDIWQRAYGFSPKRASVVGNVIGERLASGGSDRTVLLYGRPLTLKNAQAFRRAFSTAGTTLTLEEGTVSYAQFLERIKHAHAVAVPSISDVAPNAIVDAIRCGKPFLLTKYSGYAEEFGKFGIVVDPLDEKDMARGIAELADEARYRTRCERIAQFAEVRTYADVTRDMLALIPKGV